MKKKLKEIFDIATGGTPSRSVPEYWKNGTIPWIKIGNINSKYVDSCDEYITEKGLNDSSAKLFKKGTILYTIFATLGEVAVLNFDATTNQAIAGLSIKNAGNDINYLYYALKSLKDSVLKKGRGVAQNNINMKILKELEIPLPPFSDQIKIAAELDTIQSAIDNKKQQLALLDEAVKSEFVDMFGENPVESGKWIVETLGEVCSSIVRGPFGSALKKDFFVPKSDKTIKVYEQKHAIQKSSTIGSYYITQEKYEELKRFECKPGDFIMSCSGTMGEFYQLPEGCEKGIINQALCKFTLNEKLEPLFFFEWMKQSIHNLETRGSGIKNVAAVSFVKQMPMIIPSKDIQRRYTNFVQQIDKSKSLVKHQIADLQELLDSKMQEYFI